MARLTSISLSRIYRSNSCCYGMHQKENARANVPDVLKMWGGELTGSFGIRQIRAVLVVAAADHNVIAGLTTLLSRFHQPELLQL